MSTHKTLRLETRLKILNELESSGTVNFAATARTNGVSQSVVSRLEEPRANKERRRIRRV